MEQPQPQTDQFGVTPMGTIKQDDIDAMASQRLAQDLYIVRLQRRIKALEAEVIAARIPQTGDVQGGAEQS